MFGEAKECSRFGCRTGLEDCSFGSSEVGSVMFTFSLPFSPEPMEVEEEGDKVTESGIMVNRELIPEPEFDLKELEPTSSPPPPPPNVPTISPTGCWAEGYPLLEMGPNYGVTRHGAYFDDGKETHTLIHPTLSLKRVVVNNTIPKTQLKALLKLMQLLRRQSHLNRLLKLLRLALILNRSHQHLHQTLLKLPVPLMHCQMIVIQLG